MAAGIVDQLPELPGANLLVEPEGKNTAIALGLAIEQNDPFSQVPAPVPLDDQLAALVVPWSEADSITAVIPNDDFLADIQRVMTQTKNEVGEPNAGAGKASTPTEELMRGNTDATSILNTGPEAKGSYGTVIGQSKKEAATPSAGPTLPGASQSAPPAGPTTAAAAPGGSLEQTTP